MMNRDEFLNRIEGFLAESGMSASTFGVKAVNDSAFVFRLRGGRDPKLSQVEKVIGFIEGQEKLRFRSEVAA